MSAPPKTLCTKCFNPVVSDSVSCHKCRAKTHFLCAKVDNKIIELFNNNKNIIYNCDDCLKVSSNLVVAVSSLSTELREVKQHVTAVPKLIEDVKEIKVKFNELFKQNLENSSGQQKKQLSKKRIARSNTDTHANSVVGASALPTNDNDDVSSISSYPTAASNVFETDTQRSEWMLPRKRKRRNRAVVVGSNVTEELDVVVKKKFVHIAGFKPSVTTDQIVNFVNKHTNVDKQHLVCTRLTKKDADINLLTHVNFKVGVTERFYDELMKASLWPTSIRVRPFIFFPKKPQDLGRR